MLSLELPKRAADYRILCLGSHCDDIEIGCGGTILQLLEKHKAAVHWVVFSGNRRRAQEARNCANAFLKKAETKNIVTKSYPDGFFPYRGAEIKKYFGQLQAEISPDLIFTHHRRDLHQDHRLICELTWNTFRDHLILEYEIPKFDGDLGSPNVFVELDKLTCHQKIKLIVNCFKSQGEKHWFSEQTFLSMLTLRGMESRSSTQYAEAFYGRKVILG